MSYFSNIENYNPDDIEDIFGTMNDSITANKIGTVVFYEPETKTYMLGSETDGSKISTKEINSWRKVMLGVVINQHEDFSVDVLMTSFLLAQPIEPPRMSTATSKADRAKAIRAYARDMFKRYLGAFAKQCPQLPDILSLEVSMPSVGELLFIQNNFPEIFETARKCSDDIEKFDIFMCRLFNTYVYATHDGKIYQVGLSPKPEIMKEQVLIPGMFYSDFMCVFRNVKIVKDLSKQSSIAQQPIVNEQDKQADEQQFSISEQYDYSDVEPNDFFDDDDPGW